MNLLRLCVILIIILIFITYPIQAFVGMIVASIFFISMAVYFDKKSNDK